jgi:hypothetical protein
MADNADAKKYTLHRFFLSTKDGSVLKIKLALILQCNHAQSELSAIGGFHFGYFRPRHPQFIKCTKAISSPV